MAFGAIGVAFNVVTRFVSSSLDKKQPTSNHSNPKLHKRLQARESPRSLRSRTYSTSPPITHLLRPQPPLALLSIIQRLQNYPQFDICAFPLCVGPSIRPPSRPHDPCACHFPAFPPLRRDVVMDWRSRDGFECRVAIRQVSLFP
jgi:hypothetical protein